MGKIGFGYALDVTAMIVGCVLGATANAQTSEATTDGDVRVLVDRVENRVTRMQDAAARRDQEIEFLAEQILLATQLLSDRGSANARLRVRTVELTNRLDTVEDERDALAAGMAMTASRHEESMASLKLTVDAQRTAALQLQNEMSALRNQLGLVEAALQWSEENNRTQKETIADLSANLNRALAAGVKELSHYRIEFFGRLSDVLGNRSGMRLVGDRFILQSEVLFESGSAQLQPDGRRQLERVANVLRELNELIPSDVEWILRVDGHSDKVPIVTEDFSSNWELSAARAVTVVRFLIERGVPPARLAATGFGEFQPIEDRDDEIAYRRNRRIEFKLTQR